MDTAAAAMPAEETSKPAEQPARQPAGQPDQQLTQPLAEAEPDAKAAAAGTTAVQHAEEADGATEADATRLLMQAAGLADASTEKAATAAAAAEAPDQSGHAQPAAQPKEAQADSAAPAQPAGELPCVLCNCSLKRAACSRAFDAMTLPCHKNDCFCSLGDGSGCGCDGSRHPASRRRLCTGRSAGRHHLGRAAAGDDRAGDSRASRLPPPGTPRCIRAPPASAGQPGPSRQILHGAHAADVAAEWQVGFPCPPDSCCGSFVLQSRTLQTHTLPHVTGNGQRARAAAPPRAAQTRWQRCPRQMQRRRLPPMRLQRPALLPSPAAQSSAIRLWRHSSKGGCN